MCLMYCVCLCMCGGGQTGEGEVKYWWGGKCSPCLPQRTASECALRIISQFGFIPRFCILNHVRNDYQTHKIFTLSFKLFWFFGLFFGVWADHVFKTCAYQFACGTEKSGAVFVWSVSTANLLTAGDVQNLDKILMQVIFFSRWSSLWTCPVLNFVQLNPGEFLFSVQILLGCKEDVSMSTRHNSPKWVSVPVKCIQEAFLNNITNYNFNQ